MYMCENNKESKDWIVKFSYVCMGLCATLVICIIATTVWLTNTNNGEKYQHTFQPPVLVLQIDSTTANVDSITIVELKQKLDSISLRQFEWHEGYLADLRQESNNNINKYNGWLSFWIALITIVLTIVPLVFNIRAERKYKEEVERMKAEMERDINRLLKEFDDKYDKRQKDVLDELTKSDSKFKLLKVQTSAMGISAITDTKFFADDTKREENWKVFLADFNINLRAFLENYNKEHPRGETNFDQQPVREVLVHIYYVLNLWSSKLKGKSQSKRVVVLMNKISSLLTNNEHQPGENIYHYYRNYFDEFREIVSMMDALIKEKS